MTEEWWPSWIWAFKNSSESSLSFLLITIKLAMTYFFDLIGVEVVPSWEDCLEPEMEFWSILSSSSSFSLMGERLSLSTFLMKILIEEISRITQFYSSESSLRILRSSWREWPTMVLSLIIFLIIGSILLKVGAWSRSMGLIPVIHSL